MFVSGKLFLVTLISANIRLGWKGLPGKMALSLFVSDKESCFSLLLVVEKNKLEHFFPVSYYEESVVVRIKSNLLLMIFWLHIINYNS